MKKLLFISLIIFKTITTYSAVDTLTNWQIYFNNSLVYAGNEVFWSETLTQKEYDAVNTPINIQGVDIYKDSLGLNFFCDYELDLNGYFFLKDENDKLICIVQRNLFLEQTDNHTYVIENSHATTYIQLWRVFLNYPKKENPKTIKVYYLNPLDDSNFKDGKERLLATLKIFSS